jgi:hypothetical protein
MSGLTQPARRVMRHEEGHVVPGDPRRRVAPGGDGELVRREPDPALVVVARHLQERRAEPGHAEAQAVLLDGDREVAGQEPVPQTLHGGAALPPPGLEGCERAIHEPPPRAVEVVPELGLHSRILVPAPQRAVRRGLPVGAHDLVVAGHGEEARLHARLELAHESEQLIEARLGFLQLLRRASPGEIARDDHQVPRTRSESFTRGSAPRRRRVTRPAPAPRRFLGRGAPS